MSYSPELVPWPHPHDTSNLLYGISHYQAFFPPKQIFWLNQTTQQSAKQTWSNTSHQRVEEARTECQHSGQHQCKHEHINCAFETSYFDRNRRSALASTRIRDNHALRSSPPCCTSKNWTCECTYHEELELCRREEITQMGKISANRLMSAQNRVYFERQLMNDGVHSTFTMSRCVNQWNSRAWQAERLRR